MCDSARHTHTGRQCGYARLQLHRRVNVKRQASDVDQCVNDRLEAAFADKVCMIGEDEINTEGDDQQAINIIYEVFCRPICKDLILTAIDECGGFIGSPCLKEFISDLCDTNMNSQPCYTFFNRAFDFIVDTKINCFVNEALKNTCNCRSELIAEVQTQSCCIYTRNILTQPLRIYPVAFRTAQEKFIKNAMLANHSSIVNGTCHCGYIQ